MAVSQSSPHLNSSHSSSRREFTVMNLFRFRVNNSSRWSWSRLVDATIDRMGWFLEVLIYAIGPLLILLALGIMSVLTYTFFTVLIPMWQDKYREEHQQGWGRLVIGTHIAIVAALLGNILFNYFYCVITPHKGPEYEAVVRELAEATGFVYPETDAQVAAFKHDFEDKIVLRMRRQRARALEQQQQEQQQQSSSSSSSSSVQQRRHDGSASANGSSSDHVEAVSSTSIHSSSTATAAQVPSAQQSQQAPQKKPQQKQPPVRRWMLLGPYEWGFCGNTNQPKPPRSHYDHVSKQLVLNLDHYCPWMFNAIGYFNYRYFVNFLLYVCLGMLYGALILLEPFLLLSTLEYKQMYRLDRQPAMSATTIATYTSTSLSLQSPPFRLRPMLPFSHERMLLTLSFMLCVAVGSAVLMLGSFHGYLVCTAQTTIEFHANWTTRKRLHPKIFKNPYSQGSWRKNFCQIYGTSNTTLVSLLCTAFLPSRRPPDALPAPIPGHDGRRRRTAHAQETRKQSALASASSQSIVPEKRDAAWIV